MIQSLGECHGAGIAVKVVMLELSLATWMRKIGRKMCTELHPRDADGGSAPVSHADAAVGDDSPRRAVEEACLLIGYSYNDRS